MKYFFKTIILFFFVSNVSAVYSQELQLIPELKERVTDLTGLLSLEEKEELSTKLKVHEDQTSNQIAILIVPTTIPETIEEYSMRVVEKWKLGQKDKNNGVLLLFAMQDRKIRIEVGYGLEGALPDAKASRIIREIIVPEFKKRNFYEGITLGVNAIIDVLSKGEFETPIPKKNQNNSVEESKLEQILSFLLVFFFCTYIIFIFIAQFFSIEGFFLSLIAFGILSFLGSFFLPNSLAKNIAIFVNLILFILLEIIRRSSSSGGTHYYSSSGGSDSSSYSSYSGGFSGGGGDFGGGGASGSWD